MMSLRSFSRAIPRSISSVTAQCHPRTLTTISPFRRRSLLQQTCKTMSIPRFAAFSTSQAVREKEGQGMILPRTIGSLSLTQQIVDQELSAKIESELEVEREMRDSENLPSVITDYLNSSSFEVRSHPHLSAQLLSNCSSTTPQAKKKSS